MPFKVIFYSHWGYSLSKESAPIGEYILSFNSSPIYGFALSTWKQTQPLKLWFGIMDTSILRLCVHLFLIVYNILQSHILATFGHTANSTK